MEQLIALSNPVLSSQLQASPLSLCLSVCTWQW